MPKTTTQGASYAGHEGVVEDANGKLSQLDPQREATEADAPDPREVQPVDAPREDTPAPGQDNEGDQESKDKGGDSPSDGNSSEASPKRTASSSAKSGANRR